MCCSGIESVFQNDGVGDVSYEVMENPILGRDNNNDHVTNIYIGCSTHCQNGES